MRPRSAARQQVDDREDSLFHLDVALDEDKPGRRMQQPRRTLAPLLVSLSSSFGCLRFLGTQPNFLLQTRSGRPLLGLEVDRVPLSINLSVHESFDGVEGNVVLLQIKDGVTLFERLRRVEVEDRPLESGIEELGRRDIGVRRLRSG